MAVQGPQERGVGVVRPPAQAVVEVTHAVGRRRGGCCCCGRRKEGKEGREEREPRGNKRHEESFQTGRRSQLLYIMSYSH